MPLLNDKENECYLRDLNNTQVEGCKDKLIHELFEDQVKKTPDNTALEFDGEIITYRELDSKANKLAHYLIEDGVEPESPVGIYMTHSIQQMVAVLGVMKAGGTYVPLDQKLPEKRIKFMVEDAGIEQILLLSSSIGAIQLEHVDVIVLDDALNNNWLKGFSESKPSSHLLNITEQNLIYIIYTSGTTGNPKGVMLSHGNVSNYLRYASSLYLDRSEITGSVVSSPLCFDATITTLLTPLISGRKVILLPEDDNTLHSLSNLLLNSEESLLFKVTPAHLDAIKCLNESVKTTKIMHKVVVGGETFSMKTLAYWKNIVLTNAIFINEYGPTEAAVGCCTRFIDATEHLESKNNRVNVSIGRAIYNTQLYVLNDKLQIQSTLCVGELYIGGAGLARGYINQELLTQERFVANPFSSNENDRLYKTGDLVRRLENGDLDYISRNDDQVKLRGYRIELGEIQYQLLQQKEVLDALVIASENSQDDLERKLIAYIVSENCIDESLLYEYRAAEAEKYRECLMLTLPSYMVPSDFIFLNEIPLTRNGKVDFKSLPMRDGSESIPGRYVAPRNKLDEMVCQIWMDALNKDEVGIKDNFFSIGGDSILSIKIVYKLKSLSIPITAKDIFANPTVELLCDQIINQTNYNSKECNVDFLREIIELTQKDFEEGEF